MSRNSMSAIVMLTLAFVFPGSGPAVASQAAATGPEAKFSRAFGVPADGSWDGLFSGDNVLDPVRYASEKPEGKVFKSGQYALSSTTVGADIWYGTAASVWCYWPFISMAMPLTLMNHETPNHGCQMTPPPGQRPTAQIYYHNVRTGKSAHVGPSTIENGDVGDKGEGRLRFFLRSCKGGEYQAAG